MMLVAKNLYEMSTVIYFGENQRWRKTVNFYWSENILWLRTVVFHIV